ISVTPVDDTPEIAEAFQDLTVNEDNADTVIDLSNHFTDKDNDNNAITLAVLNNSNAALISATIDNYQLTLKYTENHSGIAEIIIRASSNEKFVNDTLNIFVQAIDDPPELLTPPSSITKNEDDPQHIVDMSIWFTDIDNDDAQITYQIIQNLRPDIVTPSISAKQLVLNFTENANGTSIIQIAGYSNGLSATTDLSVIVLAVNDMPTVSNGNISLFED
ncbi:hypothetical protein MHK_004204, partial [Candidatus Magnetomorum sp. HK-1]